MRHLLPASWNVCKTLLDIERKEANTMKRYVSPYVSTVELSAEDILTASSSQTKLFYFYEVEGEVIDNLSWNGLPLD